MLLDYVVSVVDISFPVTLSIANCPSLLCARGVVRAQMLLNNVVAVVEISFPANCQLLTINCQLSTVVHELVYDS